MLLRSWVASRSRVIRWWDEYHSASISVASPRRSSTRPRAREDVTRNRCRIAVGIDWRHFQLPKPRLQRGEKTKERSISEISASIGVIASKIDSTADSTSIDDSPRKNPALDRDETAREDGTRKRCRITVGIDWRVQTPKPRLRGEKRRMNDQSRRLRLQSARLIVKSNPTPILRRFVLPPPSSPAETKANSVEEGVMGKSRRILF